MKIGSNGNLPSPRREALVQSMLFVVLVLALPLGLASVPEAFNDGDVSWHIAAGRWILQHQSIPTTDPFSFTAAGHPWVAMEWLADVIYACAFNLAGYAGLAAIIATALMALHAIVFGHLQRRAGPITLVLTFLIMDFVLGPFMLARPHLLVWPLLAGWTVLLLRAAENERAPPLLGALIPLVWTNMHASFPLIVPIGLAIGFDALRKAQWQRWRSWVVFGATSLAAVMLNANGLAGLSAPFRIQNLAMLPLIQEWQPSTFSFTPQFFVAISIIVGALLCFRVRVPLGRLALLLVMLTMALSEVRHQSWFIIVAACIVPPLFPARPALAQRIGYLGLGAIPLIAIRAIWPLTPPESLGNPRPLIAAVPADLEKQPVLNGYSFGGPLILAGIRPYIDGRAEIYGDEFVIDYSRIVDGDWARFQRAAKRYDIHWTMLSTGNRRLIAELDASPSWRRIYTDKVGVIHVRQADSQRQ